VFSPSGFSVSDAIPQSDFTKEYAGKSPFKAHRKLLAARDDCMFYFKELIEQKRNYRRLGFEQDATDLIGKTAAFPEKSGY
jgi:cytochrome P450